jgi:Holliday junction resolvase
MTSRDKGLRFERAIVKLLQDRGLAAEKISRTGYSSADLSVPILNADRRVECKVRKDAFRELYRWLEASDLLIVRSDRNQPLVILPLRLASEILVAAERGKSSHAPQVSP